MAVIIAQYLNGNNIFEFKSWKVSQESEFLSTWRCKAREAISLRLKPRLLRVCNPHRPLTALSPPSHRPSSLLCSLHAGFTGLLCFSDTSPQGLSLGVLLTLMLFTQIPTGRASHIFQVFCSKLTSSMSLFNDITCPTPASEPYLPLTLLNFLFHRTHYSLTCYVIYFVMFIFSLSVFSTDNTYW